MVCLAAMTEAEFETFMEISMLDHARSQVKAGKWQVEESDVMINRLCAHLLPDGLATPNHFFFAIEDRDSGAKVGGLWYVTAERDEKRQIFVMDIQVYQNYRRRGYGTRAFRDMEEQARNSGISIISLHVFEHNRSARAMYEKLGYVAAGDLMSKELGAEAK